MGWLTDKAREMHEWSKAKGWWDDPDRVTLLSAWRGKPQAIRPLLALGLLMLAVTELAEAAEELRHGRVHMRFEDDGRGGLKPEGFVVEIADAIIRQMETCAALGLDLEAALEAKMAYNQGRPYRHGGKLA